jgi:hypothetical protein
MIAALPCLPLGPFVFLVLGGAIGVFFGLVFALAGPRPKVTLVGCTVVGIVVGLVAACPVLPSSATLPAGMLLYVLTFGFVLPGSVSFFIGLLFDD